MAQPTSSDERAAQIQEAIENAQQALERSKNFFEEHGLNSEKAKAFLESRLDDKARAEAQRAFERDMQEIEQEVHEQAARLNSSSAPSGTPRRPRPMV